MRIVDKMKEKIRHFLNIQNAPVHNFPIRELLDFDGNCVKNQIWYRGDSYELTQLYQGIERGADGIKFWAGKATMPGQQIRKIHTGLPAIIVDRLTDIIINDFNQIDFEKDTDKEIWKDIAKDSNFKDCLKKAISKTMVVGDGAFKISLDPNVSRYPIIEFFGADKVDYVYNRGRFTEIIFNTVYDVGSKHYLLKEHYGYGYITYKLFDGEHEVPLNFVPALKDLEDVQFNKELIMGHPLMFGESAKWEGRGQSIFDRKTDDFDALDEAWSQWMDALRRGRTKEYVPENLIPRNPDTGHTYAPNGFDSTYIATGSDLSENARNEIKVVQPAISHDSYLATYITALDLCLQGLISPSTLGIDVKKLDNADAQREKEKATLYTRGNIVDTLQEQLPAFVQKVFDVVALMNNNTTNKIKSSVDFGEYANPSFESQVETIAKAKTGGVMSIEASVEELYGDSKDDTWKKEEIARLKLEQGIADAEEPAINMEGVIDEGNSGKEGLPNDQKSGTEPTPVS